MTVDSQLDEKGLEAKVSERNRLQEIAEKYRLQGFAVVIDPALLCPTITTISRSFNKLVSQNGKKSKVVTKAIKHYSDEVLKVYEV